VMTARRHHYVPQCYLKRFTADRKKKRQITVFDGKTREIFTSAIDKVALEKDFNRVDIEGLEPDAFEKAMAGFESVISPALDRIIAAQSIAAEEDRVALINLICALALRNPRLRENLRDFHEQVINRVFQAALETPERWANHVKSMGEGFSKLSFEEAKRFFKKADFSVTVPRERHIQIEVQTFNEMLPILLKRNWMLLKAPRRSGGFVTCDHPVVLMWSDLKMRGGFYGPGFGCTGTEVLFPICTRLAVVGAFELKNGPAVEVNESAVASFNGAQIAYAERQVYARDRNFTYVLQSDEAPRKASRLIHDRGFRKPTQANATEAQ
jgi:Protein of unknown function (DUF4238)